MSKQVLAAVTIVLSIIGATCSILVVTRESLTIGYAAWHLWPYVLMGVLAIVQPRFAYVWIGTASVMAVADGWIFGETLLGTNSDFLMTAGLLVALKPLVLLPIGAAIGGVLHWYLGRPSGIKGARLE